MFKAIENGLPKFLLFVYIDALFLCILQQVAFFFIIVEVRSVLNSARSTFKALSRKNSKHNLRLPYCARVFSK